MIQIFWTFFWIVFLACLMFGVLLFAAGRGPRATNHDKAYSGMGVFFLVCAASMLFGLIISQYFS